MTAPIPVEVIRHSQWAVAEANRKSARPKWVRRALEQYLMLAQITEGLEHVKCLWMAGVCARMLHEPSLARQLLQDARLYSHSQLGPEQHPVGLEIDYAETISQLDEHQEAIELLDWQVGVIGDNQGQLGVLCHFKARIYLRQKRYALAMTQFDQALRLLMNAGNPDTLLYLQISYADGASECEHFLLSRQLAWKALHSPAAHLSHRLDALVILIGGWRLRRLLRLLARR